MLETCLKHLAPETLLCVASDLTLASEAIVSRPITAWRAASRPLLKNRPAIFLLLAR